MSRTKRNIKHVGWHRTVRTQQELAANHYAELDGFRVRGNRKKRRLPTSWDDPLVAARYEVFSA